MRKFRCDYHYVDDLVFRYEDAGGYAIHLKRGFTRFRRLDSL